MEMMSPQQYKEANKDKSLQELMSLKEQLQSEIVSLSQNQDKDSPFISDTRLQMKQQYFDKIWELIREKRENQNVLPSNTNKADEDEKYIKEMEKLERRIFSKDCFYLEIRSGAVLPIEHPRYYDGRVDITIDEQFNNSHCFAKIQKDEYTVDREQLTKIKQLVRQKFDILIEIAKKQTTEMYDGTYNTILIKINSILLNLSLDNVKNDDDYNTLSDLKKSIMSIIIPKSNKDIQDTVNELVEKIISLPKGTEISIGKLLGNDYVHFNTNELFQINKDVLSICREKGIVFNFDKYKDQVVGLPFNIPFIIE